MANKKIRKVSNWITGLSLLIIAGVAVADLFVVEESVPMVVYGLLGGVALGADAETIPTLLGIRKQDD